MFKQLAKLIEKHPWQVIIAIIILTAGFSTLLPSLQMKTDFSDFAPDDEVVKANSRISDYFGENQQIMLLYVEKQQTDSVISPYALKEQYYIQEKLTEKKEISSATGISTIVNQICQLEYGKEFENCSNEEIQVVIKDILEDNGEKEIKLFSDDDKNEEIDYNRFSRISKGLSIDEIDVKNGYLDFSNDTLTFTIEVYDLSSFENRLRSPIPFTNVLEWYINFENIIRPDERLNISYRISAHFEPKNPSWVIGNGLKNNLKNIFENIKNLEFFNTYEKEAYLWLKPNDQDMYIPITLESGEVVFNINKNQIKIRVSREEMGKYGIAPRYGAYELPAKLTNFKAGTRYYQTPILKCPWLRFSANTSFLFEKFIGLEDRPILGNIAGRLLNKFGNLTWDEFDMLYSNMDSYISLPDQIALKEIDSSWINSDLAPDSGVSNRLLFYKPYLFKDLQTNAKSFLSEDYEKKKQPSSCVIILAINRSEGGYDQNLKINRNVLSYIEDFDSSYNFVSVDATGQGVISTNINEITLEANQIIMPMIFVIIIFVLFFSFRKFSYVILPLIALAISMIWLFGTMVLLGIPFSTIMVAIVPLIMGLGVDYSVHLSHDYRSELADGKTPSEAIIASVTDIGTAMFLAMVTTVIAFLSFLSASVPPIRDFGIILGIGIIYTFITAITLQAAVRYLVDKGKKEFNIRKKKNFRLNTFMGLFADKVLKHQKKILVVLLLISLVGAFGATQIKAGFDFNSFLPSDAPSIELLEKIQEDFPFASQDQEYILLEGDVDSVEALQGISETHDKLSDDTYVALQSDGSVKSNSIYTIIVQAANNNRSIIEEFNLNENTYIPRSDKDVNRLYDYLSTNEEYAFQVKNCVHKENGGYNAALISVYVDLVTEGRETEDLQADFDVLTQELRKDLSDYGRDVDAIVTGNVIITNKITKSLTESQFLSTGISLLLAAIVLILVYRRPTLGIIAMIPVMISIVWILGTMYYIGYTLNVLTVTVTSLTIGIGVDYSIHATERFRLVVDKTGDIPKAVCETISRTGGALLIAALTTCLGFAVLIFAPIPPQVQFGVITAITIVFSFITSVLLLPLLLAHWARWTKKRKGYIISKPDSDKDSLKKNK